MARLCEYAGALGTPFEGFHAQRLCGLALWDVIGTVGLAWLLHRVSGWSLWFSLVVMFLLGVLCHRLFCVETTLDGLLFGEATAGQ